MTGTFCCENCKWAAVAIVGEDSLVCTLNPRVLVASEPEVEGICRKTLWEYPGMFPGDVCSHWDGAHRVRELVDPRVDRGW